MADRAAFWWNERKPDEQTLWESKIYLGESFFNEIIQHPVPIDMNTLTALKRCALGLDLYLWLTYRTFTLRAPLRLTWRQFGPNPNNAITHDAIQKLPQPHPARAKENQAGLAGVELLDGQGRPELQ